MTVAEFAAALQEHLLELQTSLGVSERAMGTVLSVALFCLAWGGRYAVRYYRSLPGVSADVLAHVGLMAEADKWVNYDNRLTRRHTTTEGSICDLYVERNYATGWLLPDLVLPWRYAYYGYVNGRVDFTADLTRAERRLLRKSAKRLFRAVRTLEKAAAAAEEQKQKASRLEARKKVAGPFGTPGAGPEGTSPVAFAPAAPQPAPSPAPAPVPVPQVSAEELARMAAKIAADLLKAQVGVAPAPGGPPAPGGINVRWADDKKS